ncbi:MAG: DUF58 domain-containing protein [Oscillospiraceae bacterium]|nr:DUF58 domain-containing protein [Oscillospiraceae bacterium]
MKRNRVLYFLFLLAAAAAWFFVNQTGTRLLLAGLLALPLMSWCLLHFCPPKVQVSWELPPTADRGDAVMVRLTLAASSRLPVFFHAELSARNLFTGELLHQPLDRVLYRGKACSLSPALNCFHSGKLELSLNQCCGTDLFGFFRVSLEQLEGAAWTVLPIAPLIPVSVTDDAAFLTDSQRYSASKPGYDPSETLQIREYQPGDAIRQIHWKLTEKTETTMVRDFGLPVLSRLLLLLQPGGPNCDASQTEAMLDTLCGVAKELLRQELVFSLGWSGAEDCLYLYQIDGPEALDAALCELLSAPKDTARQSVCALYAQQNPFCAYAHAAVFSTQALPDYELLHHGNRVTALLPSALSEAFSGPSSRIDFQPFWPELTELEL